MRLAIADPPYLPNLSRPDHKRASRWYGGPDRFGTGASIAAGDHHERAADWDSPETHRALVARLISDYEGWAIAMAADSLTHYLQWVPRRTRICVWSRPNAVPGGNALICSWEPVLVQVPDARRPHTSRRAVRDVLTVNAPTSFVGAKPRAWTRWVLDMLGYDQDTDTVDDLFGGSGAVSREIAQQVLPVIG